MVHSGRQFGGLPVYCNKQEHDGCPPMSRHSENGPHGDGMQGLEGDDMISATVIKLTSSIYKLNLGNYYNIAYNNNLRLKCLPGTL